MSGQVQGIPVEAVFATARRANVITAMSSFYAEADRRIAERPATCWNRGECCRFGAFGHRLYVTALEVAYYLAGGYPPPVTADACPHARDGVCQVRDRRPLGCRIFFCDRDARDWQGPLSEELLARLRSMHTELEVPYFYAEWLTALKAITR